MAAVAEERHGEVQWINDNTVNIGYLVRGALDASDAYAAIDAEIGGQSFNGIPFQSISLDEISENNGDWYGIGHFGFQKPAVRTNTKPDNTNRKDTYNWEVSLRESRETFFSDGLHQWNSKPEVWDPANTSAPNPTPNITPVALGYKGQNQLHEGLSVQRQRGSFSLDFYALSTVATDTYIQNVAKAVGTVNSDTFNSFSPGEVLFSEARGSHTRTDGWRFNYKFLVAPNRQTIVYGPGDDDKMDRTLPDTFEGWDVLEVYYKTGRVQSPATMKFIKTRTIIQAVLHRPYGRTNLTATLFP